MKTKVYIGNLLRTLRKSNLLTQEEVASLLHISRQAYNRLECGYYLVCGRLRILYSYVNQLYTDINRIKLFHYHVPDIGLYLILACRKYRIHSV